MFGPFDNIGSLELIQRLEKEASLVFCRDEVSYNYVTKSLPNFEPVYKAPDITISTKPPSDFAVPPHKYGCIVPNVRMFDRGESGWSEIYIERLAMTAKKMHEKGVKPIILVHSVDNTEDQPLADAVIKIVGGGICTIKRAEDPLETKAFISGSQLVVGSRYHSIVSALSSGVPAIVMGWAHKYETILDDFGMSKLDRKSVV